MNYLMTLYQISIVITQDSEQEKEVEQQTEAVNGNDVPPNIPPLPQSHLQALQNRAAEKNGSVAKIISQFQEAASINNVI
jgi:hypothetical protein